MPTEVQAKVRNYVAQKRPSMDQSPPDIKSITVPISTFPPTAMVYNITKVNVEKHSDDESDDNKPPVDMVSAAIMAKVLEDRERERIFSKHCDTCVCHKTILMVDSETQTITGNYPENSTINPNGYTSRTTDDIKPRQILNKTTGVCTKINQNLPSQIKIERQSKVTAIKLKQNKPNKRMECQEKNDIKLNPRCSEKITQSCVANPVDIINDRIWKNNWSQSKCLSTDDSLDNIRKSDIHLDVINERAWRKDTSNINSTTQVTLIEVTNAVNLNNQTPEIAASPSFSSDSVVISSSEPSSSSSDLVQSINEKRRIFNTNSLNKDRVIGPRNCLVRVSREGSKNILLDNAGQYPTVLYTSPGNSSGNTNQTNTALVHNIAKSNRSGRSLSTSSDEAFPILPNDGAQLQRVAEWVQSSVGTTGKANVPVNSTRTAVTPLNEVKSTKNIKPACTFIEMPGTDEQNNISNDNIAVKPSAGCKIHESIQENVENINEITENEIKDLISFDSTNEDEEEAHNPLLDNDCGVADYGVKITKEMEETYLKLAASLDPVALRLTTCVNPNLTIEKYRKDHKKLQLQKILDKTSTST